MQRGVEIQVGLQVLVTETCYKCKTPFAMSRELNVAARQSAETIPFYCPNGHRQVYTAGESEESKLRRERDQARQEQARLAEEAATARHEADAAIARANRATRSLKHHKKKAAAGKCPCCRRSFQALAQHMESQHPQYVAAAGKNVILLKRKAS